MATQRYISTSFWDDPWITSLKPDEKYLYLYLLTNPLTNIAGVYQIALKRIIFDTGLTEKRARESMKLFEEAGKAYHKEGYIVLPSWPKHQKWRDHKKIETGIRRIIEEIKPILIPFLKKIGYTYPIDSLSIPYAYPPNYLDTDLDLDLNTDTDAPAEVLPEQPKPEEDDIPFDTLTLSQRIEKARSTWNTEAKETGAPQYKHAAVNLPANDRGKIRSGLAAHTDPEIEQAIRNYQAMRGSTQHKAFPDNYRFPGFLEAGVEQYIEDAKPFERCLIPGKETVGTTYRNDGYTPPTVTDEDRAKADEVMKDLVKKRKYTPARSRAQ